MAAVWARRVSSEGANWVGVLPLTTPMSCMQTMSREAQWLVGTSVKGPPS